MTSATASIESYARYSLASNSLFALAQGLSFYIHSAGDGLDAVDARWDRVALLRQLMAGRPCKLVNNNCYFVWADADLIFLHFDYSIDALIDQHPTADIIISSERHAETGLANTGCFIIRQSAWSEMFLRRWWEEFDHSLAHDQIFFDRLYKKLGSEAAAHIVILPSTSLNSVPPAEATLRAEDPVLHLMGVEAKLRENIFHRALSAVCAQLPQESEIRAIEIDSLRAQLRAVRPSIDRNLLVDLFSERYDQRIEEATMTIHNSILYDIHEEKTKCINVFDIDIDNFTNNEASSCLNSPSCPSIATRPCYCGSEVCIDQVLVSINTIRELLLLQRILNGPQAVDSVDFKSTVKYKGRAEAEFLCKLALALAGRLIASSPRSSRSLQAAHTASILLNDLLSASGKIESETSSLAGLSKSLLFTNYIHPTEKHIGGKLGPGSLSPQQSQLMLEFLLDYLYENVSPNQQHLIQEMQLSFYSSVAALVVESHQDLSRGFQLFKRVGDLAKDLALSSKSNPYQLLRPLLTWGTLLHQHQRFDESREVLTELFCFIQARNLIPSEDGQLRDEHTLLLELINLNMKNAASLRSLPPDRPQDRPSIFSLGENCLNSHGSISKFSSHSDFWESHRRILCSRLPVAEGRGPLLGCISGSSAGKVRKVARRRKLGPQ